jgi:hypothetical protein
VTKKLLQTSRDYKLPSLRMINSDKKLMLLLLISKKLKDKLMRPKLLLITLLRELLKEDKQFLIMLQLSSLHSSRISKLLKL